MRPSKFNLNRKMLTSVFCSIIMAFALTGCEKDVYNPNGKGDESTPNLFPFSTTSSIQLNVKYEVPQGYKVLFEVYLEDPFITDEDGQTVKRADLEPVIRRMTDGNGAYSGKEIIDADHGNEAYIYTSYIGVPTIFQTKITENAITADINWDGVKAPQTRALTGMTEAPKGYHVLGGWDANGYPDYINENDAIDIPAKTLNTINKTLREGKTCPKQYRQSTDFEINDPQGRNAEVSVRMIGGTSSAASVFGYYCYKPGATKAEIEKAPRCIIFPNTLMTTSGEKHASGLQPGQSVKLRYISPEGEDKGNEFPNGIKIGWFLLNNKFYDGKGKSPFFSTPALNSNGRTHTAAFRIDDFVVLSFEDWTSDDDFNDIQFNVWANPIDAIIPPDLPNVNPDDKEEGYSKSYKGIVAFEDKWPHKGDYDLNDVIVKYYSTLNFNANNKVLSTEDSYELLWSGASFKNGFAYQLETDRTNVKTELLEAPVTFAGQGLDADLSKATVNVLLSAVDVTGSNTKTATYKIKNTLTTPVSHEKFGIPPYNPFIMVHDNLGSNRLEVHLVNYPPTDKADLNQFHTGEDLSNISEESYYVASGSYPFAINLSNAEAFNTPEGKTIDTSFEHFIDWVKSNGAEYKDWYK